MKDKLLHLLEENGGNPVLGKDLASSLGASRNYVARLVRDLRLEGYNILSAPNRGYSLASFEENLSVDNLYLCMKTQRLARDIRFFHTVDSTNNVLKDLARRGIHDGVLVVADHQTAGRGRGAKSFFSPAGTGVYMSFFVSPRTGGEAMFTHLTIMAAVAVAEAIEILAGLRPKIKWVNDVLLEGRKVCGILAEGVRDPQTNETIGAIVGIGVNLDTQNFPQEIQHTAGSLGSSNSRIYTRAQMIATIMSRFEQWYLLGRPDNLIHTYAQRSAVLGNWIAYTYDGKEEEGKAISIDQEGHLHVRNGFGDERVLSSGEISIRMLDHADSGISAPKSTAIFAPPEALSRVEARLSAPGRRSIGDLRRKAMQKQAEITVLSSSGANESSSQEDPLAAVTCISCDRPTESCSVLGKQPAQPLPAILKRKRASGSRRPTSLQAKRMQMARGSRHRRNGRRKK